MAVGYNPRVVTDGLVLALDAGNPKNYNAGISTNWMDKVGGNNGTLVNGTYHNDGPFVGAGYVEFDGDSDSLTVTASTDFTLDGEFTVEFWIYLNTIVLDSQHPSPITFSQSGGNKGQIYLNASNKFFGLYNGISDVVTTGNNSVTTGRWYHVAVTRDSSNNCRIFLDGVLKDTASSTFTFGNASGDLRIGSFNGTGGDVNGNISNLRVIKGTALYTSNFTPPTAPLTAVTNTVLLTCQGNTITDASSSAHTITANGDISLTKEPFAGAGAVYFDGSGDYLEIPASSDFSFTTAPWTFECWVYHKDWTTGADGNGIQYMLFPQQSSHPTYPVAIQIHQGRYLILDSANYGSPWYSSYNDIGSYGTAASLNTWNHVAYTRDSSGVDRVFVNGTLQFSATGKTNTSSSISSVARFGGNGSYYINGYISNLRLIKGTALYTSAFTPPSRTLEPIENTVLLTCQGQNIKDASSSAHTITVNGDAKATIVSSAFEFDGTDDYITVAGSSDFAFGTGDFTIEFFLYLNEFSPNLKDVFSNPGGIQLFFVSGKLRYNHALVAGLLDTDNTITQGKWTHCALVRNSGTTRWYIDGVQNSGSYSDSKNWTQTTSWYVGSYNGSTQHSNINLSNLRIYKGKGLTASEIQQNYNATKSRYQ